MSDLPLRDYQRAAVDKSHEARARGVVKQVWSMPTGSGKTVSAAHLRHEFAPAATVFLVHRDELAVQAVRTIQMVTPGVTVGVVKAKQNELGQQVTVASVQTVSRDARLDQLKRVLPRPLLVIGDESHHATANTWRHVIEGLQVDLLLGMTATAYRADKVALKSVFDEVVYHLPMLPLILQGMLAKPICRRIETGVDLDQVRVQRGDLKENELAGAVDVPARNELIVKGWKDEAEPEGRKRTVVFCVDTKHAEHVRDAFRAADVSAEMVIGETPTEERQEIYARFKRGEISVLTNCQVLTEGWDEPLVECIIMARPTKSLGLFTQCVGRGLRPSPPVKSTCLILDMADTTSKHRLASMATLAGTEAAQSAGLDADALEGDDLVLQVEQGDFLGMVNQVAKLRHLRTVEVDLLEQASYRWWAAARGKYMTVTGPGEFVALWPQGDGYVPVRVTKLDAMTRAEGERLFDRELDWQTARSLAEALVPQSPLTDRGARWLHQPASDKQIAWARGRGIAVPERWTKGDASDERSRWEFERAIEELRTDRPIQHFQV